jgi:hypothetical protein
MLMTDAQEGRLSKERERYLWQLFDQIRSQAPLEDFSQISQRLQDHDEKLTARELIYLQERLVKKNGLLFAPAWLSRFIAQLLHTQQSTILLDPIGDVGLWAASIAEQHPQLHVDVVCQHPIAEQVYKVLDAERLDLYIGTFEQVRPRLSQQYDAIVSFPPVGEKRETRVYPTSTGEVKITDGPSVITTLDAIKLLRPGGKLFVLVPPSFASTRRKKSVRRNLQRLGLYLTTLLHVRPGAFRFTGMSFDLVIIEPTDRDGLYVAEIPQSYEAQDHLIQHLVTSQLEITAEQVDSRIAEAVAPYGAQTHPMLHLATQHPAKIPTQGRIVNPETFRSFDALVAEDTARQMAQRRGLVEKSFSEVVLDFYCPRHRPEFTPCEEHPDAVYLPLMITTDATTSQAALPEHFKSYAQLIVDSEIALPEYLAHLFNTPLGHALRKTVMQGTAMSQISLRELQTMTLYLPPRKDQLRVLEASRQIKILRSELGELESKLWDQPRKSSEILKDLGNINHKERFQDWVESLPFPLASILWAYCTVDQTDKEKYERLLFFFESLATFCATILLSACRPNPEIWVPAKKKIAKSLAEQSLSLSTPTFGLWRAVLGVLSKAARTLLNGKPKDRTICLNLFRSSNREPLDKICSGDLVTILQDTNTYRNRWKGHSGSVTTKEAKSRHTQARDQLDKFRQFFGTVFTQYELIRPGNPQVLTGPVFQYPADRVMGCNTILKSHSIKLIEPAVSGHLYCFSPGQRRALKLYPFFQLVGAPQTACYFFNRIEEGSVSYFVA